MSSSTPPQATGEAKLSRQGARVAHALVAAVSGLFGVPLAFLAVARYVGMPFEQITHTFPALLRPVAFIAAGAVFAGFVVLPFRRISLFLAALAGPVLSAVFLAAVGLAIDSSTSPLQ